jgi:hypothetical protein
MVFEGTSTCPAGGGPRSRGRASAAEFQGNSGWQLISCQTTSWSLKIPQTDSNAAFFVCGGLRDVEAGWESEDVDGDLTQGWQKLFVHL